MVKSSKGSGSRAQVLCAGFGMLFERDVITSLALELMFSDGETDNHTCPLFFKSAGTGRDIWVFKADEYNMIIST